MNMTTTDSRPFLTFDDIRQIDTQGNEFWNARVLSKVLDYAEFRNFSPVIEKAMIACQATGQALADHFVEVHEMVELGSGAKRSILSYALSRHACYLIVQNADSSKPVIAHGQVYFAIQARRQELADDAAFKALEEDQKRVFLRNELREHNKLLVDTAAKAGVSSHVDFAVFQNHGYKGLYGGLDAKAIQAAKGLKPTQKILDHMGSTELAANLFRATQTEEKLKRDQINHKTQANRTHFEVGQKIRQTIQELGGTLPEALPTPASSVQTIEKSQNQAPKKLRASKKRDQ
jgi:DNA-damage-inducible protein D